MTEHNQRLATSQEVADYLRVHPRTLNRWANAGTGPPIAKTLPGGERRYDWADVLAFAAIDTTNKLIP